MFLRSPARSVLVAVLLTAPMAAAVGLPPIPTELDTTPTAPDTPDVPRAPPPPGTVMDVHEEGLTFEGRIESPSYVEVRAPDGTQALEYMVDQEGRASLWVAGENIVADGTLLRLEGDPTGDAFTLFLMDAEGNVHEATVDRAALLENLDLPPELQLPAVAVSRPFEWPGSPQRSYLLHVQDAGANRLAQGELDGVSFLQRGGFHRVALQIPLDELQWDRMVLQARLYEAGPTINVTFVEAYATEDAALFVAFLAPSDLAAADDDTIELRILYERRLAPVVVERLPEPATHLYRVDGTGPTVTLTVDKDADDFRFPVAWSGRDELSGIGGFNVDYRIAGTQLWTRWLDKTSDQSATFSGDWGTTYEFRARALDGVGNPSATPATAFARIAPRPAGSDDMNDRPDARILSPRVGALLSGAASVSWQASDPDGTPLTSKVEVSDDDGATWRTLYEGAGTRTTWDTTREADGPGYQLRVSVSDGTLSDMDVVSSLRVRNVVAKEAAAASPSPARPSAPGAPSAPVASEQPGAAPSSGGEAAVDEDEPVALTQEQGKDTPAPFVGIALVAAALLAARRRREG